MHINTKSVHNKKDRTTNYFENLHDQFIINLLKNVKMKKKNFTSLFLNL
jgi:hypothetical protein